MGTRLPTSHWTEFTISCRTAQGVWTQHCSGLVSVRYKTETNKDFADEKTARIEYHRSEYHRLVNADLPVEDPKQVYATMGEVGLQWGPTFTTLTTINSGEYEAHCVLEVPDTKKWMPEGFEYPHTIHPACLDSVIQMTIPASTPINTPLDKAKIPRFIESFYIVSCPIPEEPHISNSTLVFEVRSYAWYEILRILESPAIRV